VTHPYRTLDSGLSSDPKERLHGRSNRIALLLLAVSLSLPAASQSPDGIEIALIPGPGPGEITLDWSGGLPMFDVYRSTDASNVTAPGNLLGQTEGSGWSDDPPAANVMYYRVTGRSFVLHVDSSIVHAQVPTEVTVYTAGLSAPATLVRLIGPSEQEVLPAFTTDPAEPNVIRVVIDAGMEVGPWSVEVEAAGVPGQLADALQVVDNLVLSLDSVTPTTIQTTGRHELAVEADPASGFLQTPWVFLAPAVGGPAVPLGAETYLSESTMTAVTRAGLDEGLHDLIVINPDGSAGILPGALTVSADASPTITAVEPLTLGMFSPTLGTIRGTGFDVAGVSVDLICEDPGTGQLSWHPAPVIVVASETEVSVEFPSGLTADSVCVVELTNSADGASTRFSAVSVMHPAYALSYWRTATAMSEARRSPAVVACGRRPQNRRLYAIGGDDGTLSGAGSSFEWASIGEFGDVGTWRSAAVGLPSPRTAAGAVCVGRFIYLVGGHDGSTATDTVYRAEVLDPVAAPPIARTALGIGSLAGGFDGGLWYYAVSVLYPAGDPANPGGESLLGEPLALRLPGDPMLEVEIGWDPVPGASGYVVYRTLNPEEPDQLERLAAVGPRVTSYLDDGTGIPGGQPLPEGSLGNWHVVSGMTMNTPRAWHGVVAAPDPVDANAVYVYALAGRDAGSFSLGSYEYARIVSQPDGSHVTTPWITGIDTLGTARAEVTAWAVGHDLAPNVTAGTTNIYVAGGIEGGATVSRKVDSGPVLVGGQLAPWYSESQISPRCGAAPFVGAWSTLMIYGGRSGAANDSTEGAEISPTFPSLSNWNQLVEPTFEPRIYSGSAQDGVFLYFLGGVDNGGSTLATVERTSR